MNKEEDEIVEQEKEMDTENEDDSMPELPSNSSDSGEETTDGSLDAEVIGFLRNLSPGEEEKSKED